MPLILVLLLALLMPAWVSARQPTKRPTDERRGEELFEQNCWQCHGKRGGGQGPLAEALGGPLDPIGQRFAPQEYHGQIKVILRGRGDMPGFDQVMNRADARRILIWLADARISKKPKKKTGKSAGAGKRPTRLGKGAQSSKAAPVATPDVEVAPEAEVPPEPEEEIQEAGGGVEED